MLNQPNGKHYTEVSFTEGSKKTTLKWEKEVDGPERDEIKRKTPSLPHPDMYETLQKLSGFFCDVLDYAKAEWKKRWTIIGVKIKYKGGVPELAVTGKRELETGDTVSQTTPYIPPSGDVPDVLELLFVEAESHIEGKRNQGDLFLDPPSGDGARKEPQLDT